MQDFNFEAWFIKGFIPEVANLEKPVLLVFDSHGSHLTYTTVKAAMDHNIILICLPPNTIHGLQPADVGFLKTVKSFWPIIVGDFDHDTRHNVVDKTRFPALLTKLWNLIKHRQDLAVNGFKGSGLYPVDREAVDRRIVEVDVDDDPLPGVSCESPRKQLIKSIIEVVTPDPSRQPKKKSRKRVQHSSGEVLTSEDVLNRLRIEEEMRQEKRSQKSSKKKLAKKAEKA